MWYRTGTVAVTANSKTVTGTGTAWVQNTRVGDGFQGPDGRLYEITNVASNGALAIDPAYRGATASGQQYWIIPIPGYLKLLADRAAGLIDSVGLLPGEVAANERRIANAEQAMLTKIGNLAGLQNLKQSQLNLGVIQSLVGEVFNTNNCTVIENSNGVSFRHPQGLQICYMLLQHPETEISTLYLSGEIWRSGTLGAIYPQPFIGGVRPLFFPLFNTSSASSSTVSDRAIDVGSTSNSVQYQALSSKSGIANIRNHVVAFGKWK